ncbi:VWA domain-containing protein [Ectothiorhodospiraceae bacterium 2226]|nr:VWA domain-containing protein [Ectothiorhodospiraceae bacterium 2226]
MSEQDDLLAIEEVLQELEQISFVAHRDAREALPAIQAHGAADTLLWLRTARDLFTHDRDAGKSFIRASADTAARTGTVRAWTEQALSFNRWRGSWKALDGYMEQAGAVHEAWGAAGQQRWYEIGYGWLERHLDSGAAYFRTPFKELGGREGIEGVEALMAPAESLFRERRLALGSYLGGALRVRRLVGLAGIEPWARRGADILQAGRTRGEAYFRLESEESIALLLDSVPGVRLREQRRLLQLLLYAWFGEDFPLEDSAWTPDQGRAMIETDGQALFLPVVLPGREEALLAVLHAGAHLRFDSYERRHIEALFQEAGMAHPPLDADQRITWRPLFARFGDDLLRFQVLFDICEDLRVDAAAARLIPGYGARLRRLAAQAEPPDGAPGRYIEFARETLAAIGHAERAPAGLRGLLDEQATIVDAFRTALALYEQGDFPTLTLDNVREAYLPARGINAARPVYPRRRLEGSPEEDGFAAGKEMVNPEEKPKAQEVPKDASGGDPDFDIPPEDTAGQGGRVGVGIPQPAVVYGRGRGHQGERSGRAYREWDYRDNAFKLDWAWVQERELEESDPARAEAIFAKHANVQKRLRRALQMQRPTRLSPLRRQMDGDELDLEATMEYVTEKRIGRSPRPHVYKRRAVRQRESAVLLLADLSTSIMADVPKDQGEGKVVDRLRAGLMLFAEALDAVGDPCAIAGFASKYRDNVSYYPIKRFDEPLTSAIRARMAGVTGRLATRMGAAIRHAVATFDAPSQRRLLLILSDGRPADYDDGGDERYLHEDTRMAVKEALDAGVHPFCVTLDARGGEYLPAIFGPGHYLILDHVDDLPKRLPEVYLRLRR